MLIEAPQIRHLRWQTELPADIFSAFNTFSVLPGWRAWSAYLTIRSAWRVAPSWRGFSARVASNFHREVAVHEHYRRPRQEDRRRTVGREG